MPAAPLAPLRIVQSRHNARLKQLRATLARPSPELIGLEGAHLVEEALRSGLAVETIFVRAGAERLLEPLLTHLHPGRTLPDLLSVPDDLLRDAVSTDTPQAIAALAVPPRFALQQVFGRPPALLLVLAGVQDPGNVGAMVRSAEAFGATGVLALPGTASVWNPKSLRAAMGSSFRLPVLSMPADEAFAALTERGVLALAAVAPGSPEACAASAENLAAPVALWIGNEGTGLGPELIARCDAAVTVPCPGPVESLNAAVAAGILLYESSQQRARAGSAQHPTQA